MQILELRDRMNAPNSAYLTPPPGRALTKERAMAFLIGVLAILLAFGVTFLDERFGTACARSSISHYFYEPLAGTFFVMVLSFVGAFMIAFRGENRIDGWLATAGGIGGLVLAFFPTEGTGCDGPGSFDFRPAVVVEYPLTFAHVPPDNFDPDDLVPDLFDVNDQAAVIGDAWTQAWHIGGAAVMFVVLLVFCAWVFPRVNPVTDRQPGPDGRPTGPLKWQKRARNAVYYTASVAMVVGMLMIQFDQSGFARAVGGAMARALPIVGLGNPEFAGVARPVYHGEMLALVAFGVSWTVKGRFGKSVWDFFRGAPPRPLPTV